MVSNTEPGDPLVRLRADCTRCFALCCTATAFAASGADLRLADLTGADLRGADLSGADLTGCLFLTQAQLDAAAGDQLTRLPGSLRRPAHWAPPAAS